MPIPHLLPVLLAGATAGASPGFTVEHPNSDYWFATCTVERGEVIRRCAPTPDPNPYTQTLLDHMRGRRDQDPAAEARRHPRRLPGAAAGTEVEVLMRIPRREDSPGEAWSLEAAQYRDYPAKALVAGFEGRTSVSCIVLVGGKPDTCWVTGEAPLGKGLGYAALSVAARIRFAPPTAAGEVRIIDLTWRPPPPSTILTVSCSVRPDATSTDCTTSPDPIHPGENERVLQALAAHPLRLDGAQPGSRFDIRLIRETTLTRTATEPPMTSEPAYVAAWRMHGPPEGLERYYPPRANTMEKSGRSVLRCRVVQQRFDQCRVLSETPPGFGFAESHMRFAPRVTLTPRDPASPPPEGRPFDFAIHWSLPGEDTSPDPASAPSPPGASGGQAESARE